MTKTNTTTRKPRRMAREPKGVSGAAAETGAGANNDGAESEQLATQQPTEQAPKSEPKRKSKQDLVVELLNREGGALLTDIVEATGWLPHTARAALTGLKKKGHKVVSTKVDKVTRYTIASE